MRPKPQQYQQLHHRTRAEKAEFLAAHPRTSWWVDAPRDGFTALALTEVVPDDDARPHGTTDTYLIKAR